MKLYTLKKNNTNLYHLGGKIFRVQFHDVYPTVTFTDVYSNKTLFHSYVDGYSETENGYVINTPYGKIEIIDTASVTSIPTKMGWPKTFESLFYPIMFRMTSH